MKRGTGWIPDYPDLSDYTLEKDIEKLSEQVQSQGSTASIESLAQKICTALDILAQQADESNQEKLKQIKEDLETQVLGGVEFITVDFHAVFREGSSGPEVRSIKSYLQSILQQFSFSGFRILKDKQLYDKLRAAATETNLTKQEIDVVDHLLKAQLWYVNRYKNYSTEGSPGINLDGIVCLHLLSSLSSRLDYKVIGTELDIAEYWSDFSKKNRKQFQELIKPQEDLLRNLTERFQELKTLQANESFSCFEEMSTTLQVAMTSFDALLSNFSDLTNTGTQCVARTQFLVSLYDFWQDYSQLIRICEPLKDQFCLEGENLIDPRQIERDLQLIRTEQKRLSANLDKIQVDKANLDRIEFPLYPDTQTYSDIDSQLVNLNTKFMNELEPVNRSLISLKEQLNFIQLKVETLTPQLEAPEITYERQNELIEIFNKEVSLNLQYYGLLCDESFSIRSIIKNASTVYLPQIPPQLFSLNEIPVETPIHIDLFKLVEKELLREESLQSISQVSQAQASEEVYNLIKPIVEVVAQMLMPLGQYSGLSEAINKALDKIHSLVEQEDKKLEYEISSSSQKTLLAMQKMLQKAIEQHNSSPAEKDIMPLGDSSLQQIASLRLKKISTNLGLFDYLSPTCSLVQLINKVPENVDELLKRKQPLFRIRSKKEKASKQSKQIQFPISRKLREEYSRLHAELNWAINESCSQEYEAPDQECEASDQEGLEQPDVDLALPEFVDLSYWFSSIEDQGSLNSCTAHAGIALLEYAQHKSSGTYIDASPLFLYKVTRNLLQQTGDVGASMRDTMKAMTAFGVCPEAYWTYDETQFDQDPPAFCYSFAESYKALKYFRLDHGNIDRSVLLAQIKVLLVSEIPCAFGFTLYDSAYEESNFAMGHLPLPTNRDKVIGGHVVVAVGYHDRKIIKNSDGDKFEGALLIRNSWGRGWGQGGYGWMPYEYVLKGLTADWWSLLKAEWLASGNFGAGASAWDTDQGGDGRKGRRQ